jgi:hypothetical protein
VASSLLLLIDFGNKEHIMPMVGKKKFPYSSEGKKEAKEYGKKKGMPVTLWLRLVEVCLPVAVVLLQT